MTFGDDLAALSDLDLNQSPSKGHNQIGFGILSGKDTKSLKIGPEMAEKSEIPRSVFFFDRSYFFLVVRFFSGRSFNFRRRQFVHLIAEKNER